MQAQQSMDFQLGPAWTRESLRNCSPISCTGESQGVVRNLIINQDSENFPLVWFQHGAEDGDAISALEEMGADYVIDDCIVVNSNTNDTLRRFNSTSNMVLYKLRLKTETVAQYGLCIQAILKSK